MPTYEYTCANCKHDFERFESITAKPDKNCPKCKKKKAERRISGGGGFLFKGSGFYVTDYRKGGAAAAKTDSKPSEGKPAESTATQCCKGGTCGNDSAKTATKTETKSETKSEPKSEAKKSA